MKMTRVLRVLMLVGILAAVMYLFTWAPALAASTAHVAPQQQTGDSPGQFQYHLLRNHSDVRFRITEGADESASLSTVSPDDTGGPNVRYCLNLYMSMSNPQIDVVHVYVSVQNRCGVRVTSIRLDWFTQVVCNGRTQSGPSSSYNVGTLNSSTGWSHSSDWSTICWSTTFPYYPVNFQMSGFDDAIGTIDANTVADGSYDTPIYTFR